jgi:hypothetical protein
VVVGIAALFGVYFFMLFATLLVASSWSAVDTFGIGMILVLGLVTVGGWLLWHQHATEDPAG